MIKNTSTQGEKKESITTDLITEVLKKGAQELLTKAIEAEVSEFLKNYESLHDDQGHRVIVRNGYLPERTIQTGIGPIPVKVPRVRDKRTKEESKIHFTSHILPPYLRRTKKIEELLPWLYLKGISSGDFPEALQALFGPQAPGLSPATISRLKALWIRDVQEWKKRDLSQKHYVYFWVDGIYFNVRGEQERSCILIVIGATSEGDKELVAIEDGFRESVDSWQDLLYDLKKRGLATGPKCAVGDGALGFWKALTLVYGETRKQRCWMHKTGNVLDKLPKHLQKKAKEELHDIWMAATKEEAEKAFDCFCTHYGVKYPKIAECLEKDRALLLTFYDFPAEHWKHLRTTNPIESTFATVRLRTDKTKGCLSRFSLLAMVFRLALSAEQSWKRLDGVKLLPLVFEDVKFVNGVQKDENAA